VCVQTWSRKHVEIEPVKQAESRCAPLIGGAGGGCVPLAGCEHTRRLTVASGKESPRSKEAARVGSEGLI